MERMIIQYKKSLRLKSALLAVLCSMLILVPVIGIAKADNWTGVYLNSVYMASEDNGWIVGEKGTILHWDGNSWYSYDSPTTADLLDVKMLNSGEGWAVGREGTILHLKNYQWTKEDIYGLTTAPDTRTRAITLNAVSMVDSNNGWIVGEWYRESTKYQDYSWWDSGIILKWDGTKWYLFNSFGSLTPLQDVSMVNVNCGWAVGWDQYYGDYSNPTNKNNVFKWDGVSWSGEHLSAGLFKVSAFSTNEAWITAANNRDGLLRWNGGGWTATSSPTDNQGNWLRVVPIFFSSADSGWTAGSFGDETAIFHWNGADWQKQIGFGKAGDFSINLRDIYLPSETSGWVVGEMGTILRWDGSTWNVYASSYWPPFWSQWWFLALVAIIVVGVIGSVFLKKRRNRKKTTSELDRVPDKTGEKAKLNILNE